MITAYREMSAEQLCQLILDEQGFIVINDRRSFPVGQVIKESGNVGNRRLEHFGLRVVALSSVDEYQKQCLCYDGGEDPYPHDHSYRVVAE